MLNIGMGELLLLSIPCVGIGLLGVVVVVVAMVVRSNARKDK